MYRFLNIDIGIIQETLKNIDIHEFNLKNIDIVSLHCREEGCIRLYIPDDQEMSRGRSPRDISRAEAV